MQPKLVFAFLAGVSLLSSAHALAQHQELGRFQRDAGWTQLFDGVSTNGWRGVGSDVFPAQGWEVSEGCLHRKAGAGGGDIVTTAEFGDFELTFEWKVAAGANSGLKYRVRDKAGDEAAFGPEYQVLDDAAHENGATPLTSAGSLYAVLPATKLVPVPDDGFNRARIVARGARIEHWLNGERMFQAEIDSSAWAAAVGASKFKGRADFASFGPGRIALQDHGDEVWFRNLRLRELPAGDAPLIELYNGQSLARWYNFGDANFEPSGDSILGSVGGGSQSFLISKETFGDFIFEVDVKTEEPGNSGIQFRSHEKEGGRPFGYQIEIDPSERAWSGGLYDEARRGWLQNLEGRDAARAAFKHAEWNHFRIECVGPWIKSWVNGVPVTDYFDTLDLEGFLALQVHSGNNTRVRWRAPKLWDLGVREWVELFDGESLKGWRAESGDWSVQQGVLFGMSGAGKPTTLSLVDGQQKSLFQSGELVLTFEYRILDYKPGPILSLNVLDEEGNTSSFPLSTEPGHKREEWNSAHLVIADGRAGLRINQEREVLVPNRAPHSGSAILQFSQSTGGSSVWIRSVRALGPAQARK